MRRPTRVVARAAACLGLALALPPSAPATAAEPVEVEATGSVSGELRDGEVVLVELDISDPNGWQGVQRVELELQLRGRSLDKLVIDVSRFQLYIVGGEAAVALGRERELRGSFIRVRAENVGLHGQGNDLEISVPLGLIAQPPPGARLFYGLSALGYRSPGFQALTPPVQEQDRGFSWGTLAAAVAIALFAGGFVGNLFSSRRTRQSPSIYATVQRRLEQERSRT